MRNPENCCPEKIPIKKIGNPDTFGYSTPTPFQKNSPKI